MSLGSRTTVILLLSAIILFAGCGGKGENLTRTHEGQRVQDFDVRGQWLAYVWSPAQLAGAQEHVALVNLADGAETELDGDMTGPMALTDGFVVWCNTKKKDAENQSEVTLYDLGTKASRSIGKGRITGLEAAGGLVVWENVFKTGSEVVLYDARTGTAKTISPQGVESVSYRGPKISGKIVVWETFVWKTRKSAVTVYDIATGTADSFDVPEKMQIASVYESQLVYTTHDGSKAEVHLYDAGTKAGRVIASLSRYSALPVIEGDKIAWGEYVDKKDFKPVPGQPLMDQRDFRDIFVHEIASGKTVKVASGLLCGGSKLGLRDGRVYVPVYRALPPPGASNMVVPVDLWRL